MSTKKESARAHAEKLLHRLGTHGGLRVVDLDRVLALVTRLVRDVRRSRRKWSETVSNWTDERNAVRAEIADQNGNPDEFMECVFERLAAKRKERHRV